MDPYSNLSKYDDLHI